MKKITVIIILIMIAVTGCKKKESGTLLDDIKRRGVIKIGMSTFVPWAMNDKDGNLIGFEIDVANELAGDMGVKAEFIPTKWSGIIPALLTGKFDVIIGGMGITEERMQKVDFTDPYDYTGMSIVASRKKAPGYRSLEDFNKPDVIIAARLGTTAAEAVKKHLPAARLKLFDDEAQAVQELLTDRVHAVVASTPLPEFQAIKHEDRFYLPLDDTFTKEPVGFAMRKGEGEAKSFFNEWIKSKHASGFLKEKKIYWFRSRDWDKRLR